ncbi:MerR family transcriptional regulator [Marinicellulosiphila megalodicopiae]|uniref:MerR family transcriptional regulator n=1 Tax=Marinicellulosiphila megalodicopiae TaxID=2724896 RepID=UPI003BB1D94F
MKISDLAKRSNMNISTIRYYEKQGLIHSTRHQNNYRIYQDEDLATIQFIKRCKQSGFTLGETSTLLTIKDNKADHVCQEAKSLTQNKILQISSQIETLKSMLTALTQLEVLCCGGQHNAKFCQIIQSLEME